MLFMQWLSEHLQLNRIIAHILSYSVDLLLVGGVALVIWWHRQHERISMEAATLILIGTVFCVSTHVFPWYNPALLPWVALLVLQYPQTDRRERANPMLPPIPPDVGNTNGTKLGISSGFSLGGLSVKGLATGMVWYFACASITAYFITSSSSWPIYYLCIYDPVLIGLGIAAFVGFRRMRAKRKGWKQ